MQEILIRKLYSYIKENNPELLWQLQQENAVTDWLKQKVDGINEQLNDLLTQDKAASLIEQECMELLTDDLRPSRFHYIRKVFEEEFPKDFELMSADGQLENAIILLLKNCEPAFEQFAFSEESQDDPLLRYTITGLIDEQLHPSGNALSADTLFD